MSKQNTFTPPWRKTAPKEGSWRSIFKWGDPLGFKSPGDRLYAELKEAFNLTDDDFQERKHEGDGPVECPDTKALSRDQVKAFAAIVGEDNMSTDAYQKVKYSTGKTLEEAMRLRAGKVDRVCDLVVHPRSREDVEKVVALCNDEKIPIYVYGGGSSVNFGLRPSKGGVTLVLNTHMNKIVEVNETNQTVRVEAGMMGPAFEEALNSARKNLKTEYNYTCGHFPQSFEYSSVGGWIVTLGSGQNSSLYGDAYDLCLGVEVVTPRGTINTLEYPGTATGPKVLDMMKGMEGTFGVVTAVTWKLHRHRPENRQYFGFLFKNFADAIEAAREVTQDEGGMPSVFRVFDENETDFAMKMYSISGSAADSFLSLRGYKAENRCLFLGSSDGEKGFAKHVKKRVKKICKKHGAMYISGYAQKLWEPDRFKHPYIREDLQDSGILSDTLESSLSWDQLHEAHKAVNGFMASRPNTMYMSHSSHFYPQGTNLYYIYFIKTDDIEEYRAFQDGVIDAVSKSGGSLSHHHGVGKMIGPWMEDHLGSEQMEALRALKRHFDPNNIMNPGGQLGIDITTRQWRDIE